MAELGLAIDLSACRTSPRSKPLRSELPPCSTPRGRPDLAFELSEFFPDSPRALKQREDAPPSTFGQLADLWLDAQGELAGAARAAAEHGTATTPSL
jgi:hypothetical protein